MSAHTPGPWAFSRWDEFGGRRFYVSQADGAPYTPHFSDVAALIAETVVDERASIQEANARLIAAAPDLLAALKELLDVSASPLYRPATKADAERHARAAIAKATTKEAA